MTKADIVDQRAIAFAEGMAIGIQPKQIDTTVLKNLVKRTYIQAFEDGIVFKQCGQFPDEFYTIRTDADWYTNYAQKQLVTEK